MGTPPVTAGATLTAGQRAVARRCGQGLVLLGGALLLYGVGFLLQGWRSSAWPAVAGTVEQAVVRSSVVSGSNSSQRRRLWHVELHYVYEVGGQRLQGTRYSFGTGTRASAEFDNEAAAQSAAREWPAGSRVDIRFDPAAPARAVIEPGLHATSLIPAALGGVFLLGGLLLWRANPHIS